MGVSHLSRRAHRQPVRCPSTLLQWILNAVDSEPAGSQRKADEESFLVRLVMLEFSPVFVSPKHGSDGRNARPPLCVVTKNYRM